MIVSMRKWLIRAKFVLMFIMLTVIVYALFHLITGWIEPAQRYKEPSGKAVKVFQQREDFLDSDSVLDRLLFFYWYGE